MKAELKKKWIDALRSGEYPQSGGSLWDGDGYCALGVLLECVEPGLAKSQSRETVKLHDHQRLEFGLAGIHSDVFDRNDRGDTFEEIAYWLEIADFSVETVLYRGDFKHGSLGSAMELAV